MDMDATGLTGRASDDFLGIRGCAQKNDGYTGIYPYSPCGMRCSRNGLGMGGGREKRSWTWLAFLLFAARREYIVT